ncbi:hypothetical protein [Paraburkholderia sp. J41]|uniref:hypothetical protein n=1 Tax=Paraburkholderia sp. J41 TaxID=2805433 RepID=UPI0039F62D44
MRELRRIRRELLLLRQLPGAFATLRVLAPRIARRRAASVRIRIGADGICRRFLRAVRARAKRNGRNGRNGQSGRRQRDERQRQNMSTHDAFSR